MQGKWKLQASILYQMEYTQVQSIRLPVIEHVTELSLTDNLGFPNPSTEFPEGNPLTKIQMDHETSNASSKIGISQYKDERHELQIQFTTGK